MSSASNSAIAAAKRQLAEEQRRRKERELWEASPAGQHARDFGLRVGPWILELAQGISHSQRISVAALRVTRRAVHLDDPFEWPCGRGEFDGVLHRFPAGSADELGSTAFLVGCRCPPPDAWALVLGKNADRDGLLSYGILPDSPQFWFTAANLGDASESARYFDGSRGHDQIAPGEVVVQVSGVRDTSNEPEESAHPCSLGSFSLAPVTNFFLPLRNAEAAFRATLDAFFHGQALVPQFSRRPPDFANLGP
jgi:hypothetical protein